MIIRNISVAKKGSKITISADFRMDNEQKFQSIFIDTSSLHMWSIVPDATPFVAALLIPAMSRGESITVQDSTLSYQFLENLKRLMKTLHSWDRKFQIISITAQTKKDKESSKKRAMFFSGGVDSFYTYLKLKKSARKISYFLLVHGFDIELDNALFFSSVESGIKKLGKEERVEAISLRTNMKKIIEKYVEWDWGHGGALAAIALLLRKGYGDVYIAGALRKDQLFPYGTHPQLDKLWGTETLMFHHDGNEHDRLGKVMTVVGNSELALSHLRVCNQNLKGKYNCSKCFKCLWTMMTLECAGTLINSKTFTKKIDLEAVKNMRYTFEKNYHLAGVRIINELKKQKKRYDLQEAISVSLQRSKQPNILQITATKIAELDKKYNKKRLFLTIFALNKNQDRNTLFKLLARQGIIK